MAQRLETVILTNLVSDEDYVRKVLPYVKEEYFLEPVERQLFRDIRDFFQKYNKLTPLDALRISAQETKTLTDDDSKLIQNYINEMGSSTTAPVKEWLVEKTEEFCQKMAIHTAIYEAIEIDQGKSKKDRGVIPQLLQDALAVSFDPNIGHDYLADADSRFEYYHQVQKRIPFDLEFFNKITKGGIPPKTLNIILAGTGVGKTLIMCHFAAAYMMMGFDVLYITLEIAEERIAERIDANLLNISLDDLTSVPKEAFKRKVERVRETAHGQLIIKEYPTASAHVGHFRHLLNELKLKKSFKPQVVFIDYLNLCASSRVKLGGSVNTYSHVKAIAEELRGLASENNFALWSATQTTRSGFSNSDVGLEDTSESFGLPATADFMIAAMTNEDLQKLGQLMIKQLKNRYRDESQDRKFVVGVDKTKMRLFDCEQSAQEDFGEDERPKRNPGGGDFRSSFSKPPIKKDKFKDFKFKGDSSGVDAPW